MNNRIHPLRAARRSRKMTLQELAERVQYDIGNLSRIETFQITPRPAVAARIVAVFPEHLTELHLLYPERYAQIQQEAS